MKKEKDIYMYSKTSCKLIRKHQFNITTHTFFKEGTDQSNIH